MNSNNPILLVEDDQVDIMTLKRAFKSLNIKNQLEIARNGEEGLQYFETDKEKPCLILLDINMPKMNGLEFLQILKQDDILKKIPVVVLTTSQDEEDRKKSFDFGVAGYVVKPVDYEEFIDAIKTINNYWSLSQLAE